MKALISDLGFLRWFEPGEEVLVAADADEAVAAYREFLADRGRAEEFGRRARQRVLEEHTYAHHARRLLGLLGLRTPVASPVRV